MTQKFRLPKGGIIDRKQPLNFTFNGRSLQGYAGDSLAAALLANGIHHVARSFKFHRPRGIYSAGEEEPNALLEVGEGALRVPNSRATMVRLQESLSARNQLGWPSLNFDLGRVLDYSHRLWGAGFYNKTFKWPNWHSWENLVRGMTGLGRTPEESDPDHYEKVHTSCDVLICGGGPAGLVAALIAARSGLQVILADQDEQFGGSLLWDSCLLDEKPAMHWVDNVLSQLAAIPNVQLLPRTTVTASYDHSLFTLLQRGHETAWRECFWTVRCRATLLATGAIEQSLVFPNNDRPGIMLASAVRQYANRYAVAAGKRVMIATNNDSAYQTAFDLVNHGIAVAAIADLREKVPPGVLQQANELGLKVFPGARIADTQGGRRIKSLKLRQGEKKHKIDCDVLAVSGGWAPRLHLMCHARGSLQFDPVRQAFLPGQLPAGFSVAGSASGEATLAEVFSRTEKVSMALCASLGVHAHHVYQPRISPVNLELPKVAPQSPESQSTRQWLDLAHDVTLADAELAVLEGYESVEHFKRYTTTGMSLDQGKTGNINAFLALSAITGRDIQDIGTTTFRPPYTPVTLGALAAGRCGEFYQPRRVLAAENTHRELSAHFEDYGWQRPDYYLQEGETAQQAIHREVHAVRNAVGVFDNSPIGKIEVFGPDAAEFLHRVYINKVHNLAIGRCRYGLMLNESGTIIDDGIFIRLAEDHFLINTSSGGARHILGWLEEWSQCDWPDLKVLISDVTSQWSNFTVAGPRSRELLQKLDSDINLGADSLGHMQAAQGQIEGIPARVHRISFSGELSYEINIPSAYSNGFLRHLLELGEDFNLTPYGIEALMILRLEKGYLHIGSDTDGETTPQDVGWGQVVKNKPEDFLGKRSLGRPAALETGRRQLVGIMAVDKQQKIQAGAHILPKTAQQVPALTQGWVTSAAFSPTLQRHIALGMVRSGRTLIGTTLQAYDAGQYYTVKIVEPCFIDPNNERLAK